MSGGADLPRRVAVIGADAAALPVAGALARAGISTCLVETDPHDAARTADLLSVARRGGPVPDLSQDPAAAAGADLLVISDSAPEGLELPAGAARLRLGGTPAPGEAGAVRLYGPTPPLDLAELALAPGTVHGDALAALLRHMGRVTLTLAPGATAPGLALQRQLLEVCDALLMDGATPWEVDEALDAEGFAIGPYLAQDAVGLDLAYADRKRRAPARDPAQRYVPIADRMVEEGRLGRKIGVGWYRYPGGGGPVIDPLVEDLVREEAHFAGVAPRDFTAADIVRRVRLGVVHAAVTLAEAGLPPEDVDRAAIHGIGYPAASGGPLAEARGIGAAALLAELEALAREDAVFWSPPPGLRAGRLPQPA